MVKCSNFMGDALDMAAAEQFAEVLLVGHIGKLVKLAGGIMNTHSRMADCRTELFCTHAALCGASQATCRALMDAATTDACLDILDAENLREPVLESLLQAIQLHLDRRVAGAFRVGLYCFPTRPGRWARLRPLPSCCKAGRKRSNEVWYILWAQAPAHRI